MQLNNPYTSAHLFVAAIRILTHQRSTPPSVSSVCAMLSISEERGHHICRKLTDRGIIEVTEGAFGTKLFVADHLAIENVTREETESKLDAALKNFQDEKKGLTQKIASIQASQEEKKRKLFADLENQLKKSKK